MSGFWHPLNVKDTGDRVFFREDCVGLFVEEIDMLVGLGDLVGLIQGLVGLTDAGVERGLHRLRLVAGTFYIVETTIRH
jgi:hypothetical protein